MFIRNYRRYILIIRQLTIPIRIRAAADALANALRKRAQHRNTVQTKMILHEVNIQQNNCNAKRE